MHTIPGKIFQRHKQQSFAWPHATYHVDFWGKHPQYTDKIINSTTEIENTYKEIINYYQSIGKPFSFMKQVHGINDMQVSYTNIGHDSYFWEVGNRVKQADIVFTSMVNLPIAVRTADCVPILFFSSKQTLCGAIHAGWKGLAANIIFIAIQALIKSKSIHSYKELQFYIGPHILLENYEVEDDVASKFDSQHITIVNTKKRKLSLTSITKVMPLKAGIPESSIHWFLHDTYCSDKFFSHRSGDLGRNVSIVYAC